MDSASAPTVSFCSDVDGDRLAVVGATEANLDGWHLEARFPEDRCVTSAFTRQRLYRSGDRWNAIGIGEVADA